MNVNRFGDNSLVQVGGFRLRYINKDAVVRDNPIKGRVMKAISVPEGKQLLLSLIGGYLEYY